MTRDDLPRSCCSGADRPRCAADLPDNPACATNFHFGLLLGVDELRTEQGFHIGQARRHQRLLHGAGVVAGFGVGFKPESHELRVAPGFAVDAWGRDLALEVAQCISLPLWWKKHRGEDIWHDVPNRDDALIDLELVLRHDTCLAQAVPAIADPCAGASSDIAYARVCQTVQLSLRRAVPPPAAPAAPAAAPAADTPADTALPSHRLLRVWLGQLPAGAAGADEAWLLQALAELRALPPAGQAAARAALLAEVLARAAAAEPVAAPAATLDQPEPVLVLARLQGVRITVPADTALAPTASVARVQIGVRPVLLPTALLQSLLLAEPAAQAPAAGPLPLPGGATLAGQTVTVVFDQPLADASASAATLQVSEFRPASGWAAFTPTVSVDNAAAAGPSVSLLLDRAPAADALLRLTVLGQGAAPLLGANLLPAGAPHPAADGRSFSTAITRA